MTRRILMTVAAAVLAAAAPPAGAAQQTIIACYVPTVGAVYLIQRTDLPTACLSTNHVQLSWIDGANAVRSGDAAGGDLAATYPNPAVAKLQGQPVSATAPNAGQVLTWDGTIGAWAPATPGQGGGTATDLDCTGCVGTAELATDAVTSGKIVDGTIVDADISGTAAIADTKLATITSTGKVANSATTAASANTADAIVARDASGSFNAGSIGLSGQLNLPGTGNVNAGGARFLYATTTTQPSVFLGPNAGNATTTSCCNVGVGHDALLNLSSGGGNTAVGSQAGSALTSSNNNTLVGQGAGNRLSDGGVNVAVGVRALVAATSASSNIAIGVQALRQLLTGSLNTAIGVDAGANLTGGESSNILIGHPGAAGESNAIRIGLHGPQNATFIAAIRGVPVSDGVSVVVDPIGRLGTSTSSARFKEAVEDMGGASRQLMRLRPVQFRYKPEYDAGSRLVQYGLIAEEVEAVFPELVLYGPSGEVETVRYHLLAPLLLNELQRQERELAALRQLVADQAAALDELRAELRATQR